MVGSGKVTVEYCRRNKNIADFCTKPLDGRLFQEYRSMLINHVSQATPMIQDPRCVLRGTVKRENKTKKVFLFKLLASKKSKETFTVKSGNIGEE